MKRVFKYIIRTVGVLLIVFLLFVGSLFFREQRLPRFLVDRIERRLSTDTLRVRTDLVSFGFRHGLRLQGVRVYDLDRPDSLGHPMLSARIVTYDHFRRALTVTGAQYTRLPESYYAPSDGQPMQRVEVDLPVWPALDVTLEHPVILGASPDRVTCQLRMDRQRIDLADLTVKLPDRDGRLELKGGVTVDFAKQEVSGGLEGAVAHAQIAPVIEALDVPVALPYVAAFTEVNQPVPVRFTFSGNFLAGDLHLSFADMVVSGCRYQGVLLKRGRGSVIVDRRVAQPEAKYQVTILVDPQETETREGRHFGGRLQIDNAAGPVRLSYDAQSDLKLADLLAVAEVDGDVVADQLTFDAPPSLVIVGTNGVTTADLAGNDLTGTLKLRHGAVIGLRVDDLSLDFALKRDVFSSQARATGKTGGQIKWSDRFYLHGFDPAQTHFTLEASYRNGSLEEVADLLPIDLGERRGTVSADLELSGMVDTNLLATLNGKGSVLVTDGHLAQMKLFGGLTEILAESVPGVSYLVNQSQVTADFVIEDGLFKSENIYIEGGLISVKGNGTYDLAKDKLDFVVGVQLFKKDSLVGKVFHPLTAPLRWMFLEFRLTGSMNDPQWNRINLLDRLF